MKLGKGPCACLQRPSGRCPRLQSPVAACKCVNVCMSCEACQEHSSMQVMMHAAFSSTAVGALTCCLLWHLPLFLSVTLYHIRIASCDIKACTSSCSIMYLGVCSKIVDSIHSASTCIGNGLSFSFACRHGKNQEEKGRSLG